MTLPKAIQRQAEEAAAAQAAIAATVQPDGVAAPTPQPAEPPAPAPVAAPAQVDSWEQRYRSLQGILAKETSTLRAQAAASESKLVELTQQIAILTQRQAEPKPAQVADPKDVEAFGTDMLEMVQRYAERVFQNMTAQVDGKLAGFETRLQKLEGDVTGVDARATASLEQTFYATLKKLVPNYEEVNASDAWLVWLGDADPVYGVPRQAALDAAFERLDAPRVANVFKAFEASRPPSPSAGLEAQVAPNGVAPIHSSQQAPSAPQVMSAKFVEKFYNDVAKGRYLGREGEVARIEAEIQTAAAAGLIR